MLSARIGASGDMPPWAVWLAVALAAVSLGMLLFEMTARPRTRGRRERGGGVAIAGTGLLAVTGLLLAVLRPARVSARESVVGARVVVLADASRSMALKQPEGMRWELRDRAVDSLAKAGSELRLTVLGFGEGGAAPLPMTLNEHAAERLTTAAQRSDLAAAIRSLAASPEERPAAVVVVSDGRLDDPPEDATDAALRALGGTLRVPIHTLATTPDSPRDASVRRVSAAGAAVAHVPLPVRVEVGCAGGLACDEIPVTARELRDDVPAQLLASGTAHVKDGKAALDLTITLERAGPRIVEFAITPPGGDTVPENDRRLVTFDVTRERVRVLHVAGRPTNDVRALRQWLKSDASVDVVAFFILRTPTDEVRASQAELALIPFPVDELFQDHLPSFDAIVLQDFDAQPYQLEKYLPNIERYVQSGGGLVMVGGENSFVAGGYAGTPLARVLPVALDDGPGATSADTAPFEPQWTPEGKAAPLLAPLRDVVGNQLPQMPGANILGDLGPGGVALWTHPSRKTKSGAPMPVLAVGEEGSGRAVALGIDGAWELEFSELGARTAGRGHAALWDGLLGWLMRDPRFEPAQLELANGCTAGLPSTLRARVMPVTGGTELESANVSLEVTRIDQPQAPIRLDRARAPDEPSLDFDLPPLAAGGYTARLRVGRGSVTRRDFACEAGGDEWADSRPDPARLERLARATGGTFADAAEAASLPLPRPTVVSAERHVTPLAPPWVWSLTAAALLGLHWVTRRKSGLS
jgi:uncharacterized membrane protein